MNKPPVIKTILNQNEFRLKEKGSLFIAQTFHVESIAEAVDILANTRKQFYDASHHCYSFLLVEGGSKYSDDGEPNGTAGIRILNAQNHLGLTNILTVVTRYFGGIKLGVGPLGKAYYESSIQCLESANIEDFCLFQKFSLKYFYEQSRLIHHIFNKYNVKISNNGFEDKPFMNCLIEINKVTNLEEDLKSFSPKEIQFKLINEFEYLKK